MDSEDEEVSYGQDSFDPEEAYEVIDDDFESESDSQSTSESDGDGVEPLALEVPARQSGPPPQAHAEEARGAVEEAIQAASATKNEPTEAGAPAQDSKSKPESEASGSEADFPDVELPDVKPMSPIRSPPLSAADEQAAESESPAEEQPADPDSAAEQQAAESDSAVEEHAAESESLQRTEDSRADQEGFADSASETRAENNVAVHGKHGAECDVVIAGSHASRHESSASYSSEDNALDRPVPGDVIDPVASTPRLSGSCEDATDAADAGMSVRLDAAASEDLHSLPKGQLSNTEPLEADQPKPARIKEPVQTNQDVPAEEACEEPSAELPETLQSVPEQVRSRMAALEQDLAARVAADSAIEAAIFKVEPGSPDVEPGSPEVEPGSPELEPGLESIEREDEEEQLAKQLEDREMVHKEKEEESKRLQDEHKVTSKQLPNEKEELANLKEDDAAVSAEVAEADNATKMLEASEASRNTEVCEVFTEAKESWAMDAESCKEDGATVAIHVAETDHAAKVQETSESSKESNKAEECEAVAASMATQTIEAELPEEDEAVESVDVAESDDAAKMPEVTEASRKANVHEAVTATEETWASDAEMCKEFEATVAGKSVEAHDAAKIQATSEASYESNEAEECEAVATHIEPRARDAEISDEDEVGVSAEAAEADDATRMPEAKETSRKAEVNEAVAATEELRAMNVELCKEDEEEAVTGKVAEAYDAAKIQVTSEASSESNNVEAHEANIEPQAMEAELSELGEAGVSAEVAEADDEASREAELRESITATEESQVMDVDMGTEEEAPTAREVAEADDATRIKETGEASNESSKAVMQEVVAANVEPQPIEAVVCEADVAANMTQADAAAKVPKEGQKGIMARIMQASAAMEAELSKQNEADVAAEVPEDDDESKAQTEDDASAALEESGPDVERSTTSVWRADTLHKLKKGTKPHHLNEAHAEPEPSHAADALGVDAELGEKREEAVSPQRASQDHKTTKRKSSVRSTELGNIDTIANVPAALRKKMPIRRGSRDEGAGRKGSRLSSKGIRGSRTQSKVSRDEDGNRRGSGGGNRQDYVETLQERDANCDEHLPLDTQGQSKAEFWRDSTVKAEDSMAKVGMSFRTALSFKAMARGAKFRVRGDTQLELKRESAPEPDAEPTKRIEVESHVQKGRRSSINLDYSWMRRFFEGVEIRRRDSFEGRLLSPRSRILQENAGGLKSAVQDEADQFLELLREKGDGSVGIAWRRFFDTDGDGALDFGEFCNALIDVDYQGDTVALWRQFGGDKSTTLGLEVLDAKSAEIIEFFRQWCVKTQGGPLEMFYAFDDDGSDCLQPDELADGLNECGFFEEPDLPECINSEEKMLRVLYPLLDRNGRGALAPEELLFMELDLDKRKKHEVAIMRRRKGIVSAEEEAPNEALELLKDVAMATTKLGKRHWKMVNHPLVCGSISRSLSAAARSTPKRTPRFLREFREAKRAALNGEVEHGAGLFHSRALCSPTGIPPPAAMLGKTGDSHQEPCDGGGVELREGWLPASVQAEAKTLGLGAQGQATGRLSKPKPPIIRSRSASSGVLDLREGWLPATAQAEDPDPFELNWARGGEPRAQPAAQDSAEQAARPGTPAHIEGALQQGSDGLACPEEVAGLGPSATIASKNRGSGDSGPVMAWVGTPPLRRCPKPDPAAARASVERKKSQQRHKAYGQGLAPAWQGSERQSPGRRSTPTSTPPGRRRAALCSSEAMSFNPHRLHNFLMSTKSRSLCEHYGVIA